MELGKQTDPDGCADDFRPDTGRARNPTPDPACACYTAADPAASGADSVDEPADALCLAVSDGLNAVTRTAAGRAVGRTGENP